jgi:hypothetical protein
MALVATSLDFSVAKELAGESKNASSGMQTLNDRSSIGNETLKTETASFRGIDTGFEMEQLRLSTLETGTIPCENYPVTR